MSLLESLSSELSRVTTSFDASLSRVPGLHGSATGLAWQADQLVTVARIAMRRDSLEIVLPSGERAAATVAGRDPATDLALLRVEGAPLSPAPRAEAALSVGALALVLGRPGRTVQATLGVVRALGGAWRAPSGAKIDQYIDVDASLPDGFSGGPLVNASGEVVGLNTAGLIRGGTSLPLSTVSRVVAQLAEHGAVRRGYLGVGLTAATLPDGGQGLLVGSVDRDSPAAAAGLLVGDLILRFEGAATHTAEDLAFALADTSADQVVSVDILRGGEAKTVAVTLGERRARRC